MITIFYSFLLSLTPLGYNSILFGRGWAKLYRQNGRGAMAG